MDVDKIEQVIRNATPFPDERYLGTVYDPETDTERRETLEEFVANTYIHDRADGMFKAVAKAVAEELETGSELLPVPIAPPATPTVFADVACRIAFIPEDKPDEPIALELNFEGEHAILANARMAKGRMQIDFVSGFGRTRTLQLSPAEYLLLLAYGDRFFQELPR